MVLPIAQPGWAGEDRPAVTDEDAIPIEYERRYERREVQKWRELQEEDPVQFQELMRQRRTHLRERLEYLKEHNPERYEAVKDRIRDRRQAHLRELRERDPERFQELIERKRAHLHDRLEYLKEHNPEKFRALQQRVQEHPKAFPKPQGLEWRPQRDGVRDWGRGRGRDEHGQGWNHRSDRSQGDVRGGPKR